MAGFQTAGRRSCSRGAEVGVGWSGDDEEVGDGTGLEVPTRYIEWLTKSPEQMALMWNDPVFRETLMIVLEGLF